MSSVHEQLTEHFRQWEIRGRGWHVFQEPVYPEPPFRPFLDRDPTEHPAIDDGRKPTFLSSFVRKIAQKIGTEEPNPEVIDKPIEPEPIPLIREPLVELQTSLPAKLDISPDLFAQFLRNLALCQEPLAFELLGLPKRIMIQVAADRYDAPHVYHQLQAHFSEAVFQHHEGTLESAWLNCESAEAWTVEFGLEREFMFTLACGKIDPFIGLVGALSELQPGELGLFQVLFQPASHSWAESITNSVIRSDGRPRFVNAPELAVAAEAKVGRALYAAVVRIAARTQSWERTLQLARGMASSLRVFAHPQGNSLIPLANTDYPYDDHIEDVLRRQSRRSGMLLTIDELMGFVHLPTSAVRSPALERDSGRTKAAPAIVRQASGILLGNNIHAGESIPIRLTPEQRVRHTHIIGASGTGKSTLLFNLIRQDIENGEGVAVLDPHGDLVDKLLSQIPSERFQDVVLIDPADEEYSIGFNILQAHSEHEKTLLASDLTSVFQRLSSSWGDQMQSVLQNSILAFLNSPRKGTLADLLRFLIEPAFRTEFLQSVSDPNVLYYWRKGFAHLSGNRSIGPVITRLEMFLAQRPIAHMVCQSENRLHIEQIMDSGKILLAKLPEGLLGRENSYLLGTLLISKFQQLAMARQSKQIAARRDFWLYADEFANFITPSTAEILCGARKYRIGLTLAHHELHQVQRNPEVASAVMTHPFTRIVFRVGDDDARKIAEGFSFFKAEDFKNLETGQALCRVERSNFDFNLSIPLPPEMDETVAQEQRLDVIRISREKYGMPRKQVEEILRRAWEIERPILVKPTASPVPETSSQPAPAPVVAYPKPSEALSAEVPKQTVSESRIPVQETSPIQTAVVQKPAVPRKSLAPRGLGIGGEAHRKVQEQVKQAGHKFGFQVVIEGEIPGSMKKVDVLLKREAQVIACEVAINNSVDYEVSNVLKCLKAGFPAVAIICPEEEKLMEIQVKARHMLGKELPNAVTFFHPDQFIEYLGHLPAPAPSSSEAPMKSHGYKLKVNISASAPEEQARRDDQLHRVMSNALRRQRTDK
jgi:hypothetical protein